MPGKMRVPLGRGIPSNAREWSKLFDQMPVDHVRIGQTDYDTGTGLFFGFHEGVPKFSLGNSAGNKVTWDGSTLSITGTVTATTGVIGGWTIAATHLTAGTGATTVRLDSGGTNPAISAGSATPGSAPFRVTQAGALTATNATISGAITSSSGTIGGWTLGADSLVSGSGANTVRLDSGGSNPAISAGSATPGSAPFRVTQAGALTATSATVSGAITATSGSFTGGVTVGSGGSLSSGQSAYDTGTGFWFEYNSGTPRFSIGNATGNKLTWDGSALSIVGVLNNAPQTFTPSWGAGFSVDPTGDFSYIDFGAYVILWSSLTGLGTSDDTTMSITNLPSAIRPTAVRSASTVVLNDGEFESAYVSVSTDGTVSFLPLVVVASRVRTGAFSATGDKAWPSGAMVVYPK